MPMPDQAPAAEEEAAEPAQDQAAEAAAEEEKDYKALYEEALAQSRFDYQSVRHCSKTTDMFPMRRASLITSQFDTAPKRFILPRVHDNGLITSQFDTAPKPEAERRYQETV